jgi:hypothetical protein
VWLCDLMKPTREWGELVTNHNPTKIKIKH